MTADQATGTAGAAVTAEPGASGTTTEPAQLTGPQLLTDELIDAVATSGCGWSRGSRSKY